MAMDASAPPAQKKQRADAGPGPGDCYLPPGRFWAATVLRDELGGKRAVDI